MPTQRSKGIVAGIIIGFVVIFCGLAYAMDVSGMRTGGEAHTAPSPSVSVTSAAPVATASASATATISAKVAAVQALPACEIEDGSEGPVPCRWDAEGAGNGMGASFNITRPHAGVTCFMYDHAGEHLPFMMPGEILVNVCYGPDGEDVPLN